MVKNVADPEQVNQADLKERINAKDETRDLLAVLATPQGRRVMWRVLTRCHLYHAGFCEPNAMMFREGERNVGAWLQAEIIRAGPEAYIEMMKNGDSENE